MNLSKKTMLLLSLRTGLSMRTLEAVSDRDKRPHARTIRALKVASADFALDRVARHAACVLYRIALESRAELPPPGRKAGGAA